MASVYLSNVTGAPGKLELFLRVGSPPGTHAGRYIGQGKWSDVGVLPKGCLPEGECESIGQGRVWIDGGTLGPEDLPPKHISGKYEIDLNGKRLEGHFEAKEHFRKVPVRLCE